MTRYTACLLGTVLAVQPAPAPLPADEFPYRTEREWTEAISKAWKARGIDNETEVKTPDGSYCDLVTKSHAYEVEWASGPSYDGAKWKEAIGQAVYYHLALRTQPKTRGVRPGIILLMHGQRDKVEYLRCARVCDYLDITLETVDVSAWTGE